jgi:hypothetical protein
MEHALQRNDERWACVFIHQSNKQMFCEKWETFSVREKVETEKLFYNQIGRKGKQISIYYLYFSFYLFTVRPQLKCSKRVLIVVVVKVVVGALYVEIVNGSSTSLSNKLKSHCLLHNSPL